MNRDKLMKIKEKWKKGYVGDKKEEKKLRWSKIKFVGKPLWNLEKENVSCKITPMKMKKVNIKNILESGF